MILQTTLSLAAAAIIINFWLGVRCMQVRIKDRVLFGDGGNDALLRRMRAQANFIENAPLALVAIGLIELAGKAGGWLAYAGAAFMLARVLHALGMDIAKPNPLRAVGFMVSLAIQIGLAVVAVLIALGRF